VLSHREVLAQQLDLGVEEGVQDGRVHKVIVQLDLVLPYLLDALLKDPQVVVEPIEDVLAFILLVPIGDIAHRSEDGPGLAHPIDPLQGIVVDKDAYMGVLLASQDESQSDGTGHHRYHNDHQGDLVDEGEGEGGAGLVHEVVELYGPVLQLGDLLAPTGGLRGHVLDGP